MSSARFLIILAFGLSAFGGAQAGAPLTSGKAQLVVPAAGSPKTPGARHSALPLKPTVSAGTVNVATQKLDLDRLSLSDFGDLEQQTR